MSGELLIFENGSYGMAQNLETTDVGIIILGDFTDIREGDSIRRTGKIMEVPAGDALIGQGCQSSWSTSGWLGRHRNRYLPSS